MRRSSLSRLSVLIMLLGAVALTCGCQGRSGGFEVSADEARQDGLRVRIVLYFGGPSVEREYSVVPSEVVPDLAGMSEVSSLVIVSSDGRLRASGRWSDDLLGELSPIRLITSSPFPLEFAVEVPENATLREHLSIVVDTIRVQAEREFVVFSPWHGGNSLLRVEVFRDGVLLSSVSFRNVENSEAGQALGESLATFLQHAIPNVVIDRS